MVKELMKKFVEVFGEGREIVPFFAPGRVNLIGEHTDYNGGHVFPCALTIGTYGVVRKRNDRQIRFYSMNFDSCGVLEGSLDTLVYDKNASWTNYPKGVIWAFKEHGYEINEGFDFACVGNIPNGSGLSSSASLEVLMGKILIDLYGFQEVDMVKVALYSQYAENKFVGVNCGIMDQFAIAMGKKDCAIYLDTATLTYEYAPIALDDAKIVIMNTNKKRGLGESKYNERRAECEKALSEIQTIKQVQSLGELTEEEFEQIKYVIQDPIRVKRAKHAVYENQRTVKAVTALKNRDMKLFGALMNDSHISLRDDYEVTGKELDTLVEAAWKQEGVIGARMTGAGFGGCAVSIVKSEQIESFIEAVSKEYREIIGYDADFYVVEVGGGPAQLEC